LAVQPPGSVTGAWNRPDQPRPQRRQQRAVHGPGRYHQVAGLLGDRQEVRAGRPGGRHDARARVRAATATAAAAAKRGRFLPAAIPGRPHGAGQFRDAAEMAGLDVLVAGPGHSGVDLLDHLATSDAGRLWLSARSGMNITPLRLDGVPLQPVSVLGRYLPLRWQDANARCSSWRSAT
jgi:hypothetical protein